MVGKAYTQHDDPNCIKQPRGKREVVKRFCTPRLEDLPRRGENRNGKQIVTRTSWILWYAYPEEIDAVRSGELETDTLYERLERRERIVFDYGHRYVWGQETRQAAFANYNCPECGGSLLADAGRDVFKCTRCGESVAEVGAE